MKAWGTAPGGYKKGSESAESAKYKVSDKTTLIGIRAYYSALSALAAFNGFHLGRWPRLSYFRAVGAPDPGLSYSRRWRSDPRQLAYEVLFDYVDDLGLRAVDEEVIAGKRVE